MQPVRWAVVGGGAVSRDFSRALKQTPGAVAQAAVSRDGARARDFARQFGFVEGLDLTSDVFARPDIDVFYIAAPTAAHRHLCLLAIEAGKAVLCEKPMTASPEELREVQSAAQSRKVFVMEGMWLIFNAAARALRQALNEGLIGEPLSAHISVGYAQGSPDEPSRDAFSVFGCYGLSLAHFLFGSPRKVSATGKLGPKGAIAHADAALLYPGFSFQLRQSAIATLANELEIVGTRGRLRIPGNVVNPRRMEFSAHGGLGAAARLRAILHAIGDETNWPRGARGSGFVNEIAEVNDCWRRRLSESPIHPLTATLATHRMQRLCRESVALDGAWLDGDGRGR